MHAVSGGGDRPDAHRIDPSARLPQEAGAMILQAAADVPAGSSEAFVWDQVFPQAIWRRVIGDRPVSITVQSGPGDAPVLVGSTGDRTSQLGPLGPGPRTLTAAEADLDWLWVDGGARRITWTLAQEASARPLPPVAVVLPTYRREQDATEQSRRFLAMDVVSSVIVIDQGGTLAEHPAFQRLRSEQEDPERLRLIIQRNLGGSGGYARGMMEAAQDPTAAVLLSDDDAVLSEESLRRMLTYQTLADQSPAQAPAILGTPLFSATEPHRLIAHTEGVDRRPFQWRAADRLRAAVDLAGTTPVDWDFLDARSAADYTGWWGTLFPPGASAELGLPLPLFLKWDDAEYGLRAVAHGYAHAVLPGTAVHHPPWNAYRTQMTWTARVLHRNRLAVAAAYGAGRGVIGSSLVHQVKHVLSGHLLTAELWQAGISQVLQGPEDWLGKDFDQARSTGAAIVADWTEQHAPGGPLRPTRQGPLPLAEGIARSAARLLRADRAPRVVLEVPADEVHWRTTLGADAIIVTDEDGREISSFTVTGSSSRRLLETVLRTHAELALRWSPLRRRYHRALPRHTSQEAWSQVFSAEPDQQAGPAAAMGR